jgi:hypothetical protein
MDRMKAIKLMTVVTLVMLAVPASVSALNLPLVKTDELATPALGALRTGWVDPTDNTFYVSTGKGPARFGLVGGNVTLLQSTLGKSTQGIRSYSNVRVGDFIYNMTATASGAINRLDAATFENQSADVTTASSAGGTVDFGVIRPERMTTDGTNLYINHDAGPDRGKISKYSITETGGTPPFALNQEWVADTNTGGVTGNRFAQPGYWNGKVYAQDWSGTTDNLYEFDAVTGAFTLMGTNSRRALTVSRVGDQILTLGQVSSAADIIPVIGSTLGTRVTQSLAADISEQKGSGPTYSGNHMTGFFVGADRGGTFYVQHWVPEPATLTVTAVGGLLMLKRRRQA